MQRSPPLSKLRKRGELHVSDRDDYAAFLAASPQRSVFAQPWWLDITTGGADRWRPNVVRAADGSVRAAWPLPTREERGTGVAHGAPYTPFVGPMLASADVTEEVDALDELSALLEREYLHVEAACTPEFDYWTPLSWHGFTQTTRTTWRIAADQSIDDVRAAMRKKTRGSLRAAERDGLTVVTGSVEDLLEACAATFERNLDSSVPARTVLATLAAETVPRGAGEILAVRTDSGELASAGLFVFDDRWTWNLANGRLDVDGAVGAPTLLLDAAIERALARGTGFDFEGSMLRPVERFVRGFGGGHVQYSVIHRSTPQWERHVARKRRIKRLLRR